MWELDYKESWVPKNWCFWTEVLEKTLRVPFTARRFNQSILKVSLEYSLEGLMLKLKRNSNTLTTWCEELNHLKRLWCLERLKVRGEGDNRGWDSWMDGITDLVDVSLSKLHELGWTGSLACCNPWCHKVLDSTELLNSTDDICMWAHTVVSHRYKWYRFMLRYFEEIFHVSFNL